MQVVEFDARSGFDARSPTLARGYRRRSYELFFGGHRPVDVAMCGPTFEGARLNGTTKSPYADKVVGAVAPLVPAREIHLLFEMEHPAIDMLDTPELRVGQTHVVREASLIIGDDAVPGLAFAGTHALTLCREAHSGLTTMQHGLMPGARTVCLLAIAVAQSVA